jgi:hypothetical protein
MFRSLVVWTRWVVLGVSLSVLTAGTLYAQQAGQAPAQQPAQGQPAQQAQAAPAARVFGSDAGMVLNFIKGDKTADFEAVMAKLKEALQKSPKPERKQQAAGWKVFKAAEPGPGGSALYVFVIDPSVKGADYTVATILSEGLPAAEVQALYKQYADAYAQGQNILNLTVLQNMGQ